MMHSRTCASSLLLVLIAGVAGCVNDTPFGRSCQVDADCGGGVYACKAGYCVRGDAELESSLLEDDDDAGSDGVTGGNRDAGGDGDGGQVVGPGNVGEPDGGVPCTSSLSSIARHRLTGADVPDVGFGTSFLLDGDLLYVGAPHEKAPEHVLTHGVVRAFSFAQGTWVARDDLRLAPDAVPGGANQEQGWGRYADNFGSRIAKAGGFLLVAMDPFAAGVYEHYTNFLPLPFEGRAVDDAVAVAVVGGAGNPYEHLLFCGGGPPGSGPEGKRADVAALIDRDGNPLVAVGSLRSEASDEAASRVCVFLREGVGAAGTWYTPLEIFAPEPTDNTFGSLIRLADQGDRLVVRGQREGKNVLYSYRRAAGNAFGYTLEGEVSPPSSAPEAVGEFWTDLALYRPSSPLLTGYAVAGTKDWVSGDDEPAGSAFLFDLDAGAPAGPPFAALAPDAEGAGLGQTVAARGPLVALGSRDLEASSVALYEEICGDWRQVATLSREGDDASAGFGASLAVNERHVVVGAPAASFIPGGDIGRAGAVYVFSHVESP